MSLKVKGLEFKIINGPSRDRLFDVCKYTYDQDAFITAMFELKGETKREVEITSINTLQHESGNGESFNIEGIVNVPWLNKTCERFSAYYDSKSRNGHLKIILG